MFLALISIYVLILQILKIVYLLFKPKFLNAERFGPPKSKGMLLAYYLIALFFLIIFILDKLRFINVEIKNLDNPSLPSFPDSQGWWFILIFALIGGTLSPYILKKIIGKKTKA